VQINFVRENQLVVKSSTQSSFSITGAKHSVFSLDIISLIMLVLSASQNSVFRQTPKTVFDNISKNLKVRQKYFAARRIFNYLLGVWRCGQTRSFRV